MSKSRNKRQSFADSGQVHLTFNPVILLPIIAIAALVFALYKCRNPSSDDAKVGATVAPKKTATSQPEKPFALESMIARRYQKKSVVENVKGQEAVDIFRKASMDFRKNKEKSVAEIENVFRGASRDITRKKESLVGKALLAPVHKWHATPGVQPGTLKTPDVGYTTVANSLVDKGFPGQKSAAFYSYEPVYKAPDRERLLLARNISVAIDSMGKKENEIGNELGSTDHSWTQSNNLKDGITGETWNGDRADWAEQKAKMKDAMKKILSLFDSVLTDRIFPDAKIRSFPDQQIQVLSGEKCVMLERYYEYVSNTLAAQLGSKPPFPMKWGLQIKLGLENIESSIGQLQNLLLSPEPCFYEVLGDRTLLSVISKKKVALNVIWPQDQSVLISHEMKIKV